MPTRREQHAALVDRLICALRPANATLIRSSVIPWASATFAGERHIFNFSVAGIAASSHVESLAKDLGDMEFDLPGHLVADIMMSDVFEGQSFTTMTVEALTVDIA